MKGVVLAGGTGSRLYPLTKITNKHLLPVYDKPMVYYPIQTLVDAGIRDVLVVTGGRNSGDFLRLLANGKEFGLKHIDYTYQEGEGGIAEALALAEHFAEDEKICVVLGDNIIEGSIASAVNEFQQQERGARILLKKVPDAERFGVAEIQGDRIVGIEEKPKRPKSSYAVTGIYMFDHTVFEKIRLSRTFRPGRARNYRRQQCLHPGGNNDVLLSRRLVDGCRDVRFSDARRKYGEGVARSQVEETRRGSMSNVLSMNALGALDTGEELRIPECVPGIGKVILSPTSTDLIAGVVAKPYPIWPDDRGYFLEVARLGEGLVHEFPSDTTQISAAAELPWHHQSFPLSQVSDRLLGSFRRIATGRSRGSARGFSTHGAKNTLYVGALRPWQILIPPGVAHGYKVIGEQPSVLVYVTNRQYNPSDEGRIPYNHPGISYDWELQHK